MYMCVLVWGGGGRAGGRACVCVCVCVSCGQRYSQAAALQPGLLTPLPLPPLLPLPLLQPAAQADHLCWHD